MAPLAVAPVAVAPAQNAAASAPASSLTPEELDALRRFLRNMASERKSSQETAPAQPRAEVNPAPTSAARITVKLPAAARLWVDHVECPLTSSLRSFNTPALAPNQSYTYTLRAEMQRDGQTVRDSQRVLVSAGRAVEVDFSRLGSVTTAQR